ncbi:MAG: glycosyltransferase [Formivibrio sp.]|nr:glycosyltransferase [Formivibrio sp.]
MHPPWIGDGELAVQNVLVIRGRWTASDLNEAFALLAARRTDIRLEIAGAGSLRKSLEQQRHRLGASAQVTFLGRRDDLSSVMADRDIFVLPSLDEGFGVTPPEGLAAGLPVVAIAVGCLCELDVHGPHPSYLSSDGWERQNLNRRVFLNLATVSVQAVF